MSPQAVSLNKSTSAARCARPGALGARACAVRCSTPSAEKPRAVEAAAYPQAGQALVPRACCNIGGEGAGGRGVERNKGVQVAPAGCLQVLSTRRHTCPHKHAGDACTCTMLPAAALASQGSPQPRPGAVPNGLCDGPDPGLFSEQTSHFELKV